MKMTIQNQILEFNNDFQVQSLRAKYNRPTFFELMAKGRSETVHSAFLSWLLQGEDLNQQGINLPIVSLLGILVGRDAQQNNLIPTSLKKAIITRSIKIDNVKALCEYPVKKMAFKKYNLTNDENIQKIATKSQDRIDLLIDCDIQAVDRYKKIQIILENKVSSLEGSSKKDSKTGCEEYDLSDQTSRYFMGAKCDDGETYQIFVYLTPLPSQNLDDYTNLSSTQKCGKSDEFIQINYQDIADRVVTPLLWSDNLSDRARMLLEEYMETLTIPALTNSNEEDASDVKKMLVMASKEEDRNQLLDFLNKYQNLIVKSVLIANPSIEIDNYGNCESIIKDYLENIDDEKIKDFLGGEIDKIDKNIIMKPKRVNIDDFCKSNALYSSLEEAQTQEELESIVRNATRQWKDVADELTQKKLNDIFGKGVVRIGGKKNRVIEYKYTDENAHEQFVKFQVSEIVRQKKSIKISLCPIITWDEFFKNDDVYDLALLYDFYKQNSRLIVAAMKILVESSNASMDLTLWQDLYDGLTSNVDRTKYRVTIDGISSGDIYLNKREVVKFIIQNIYLDEDLINKLNNAVPRMFLKYEDGDNQEFDRSRYEGLKQDEDTDLYVCHSLKEGEQYSLYVSNQWGVLPLSDKEKNNLELHPSGKGGNFGKLLDFFIINENLNVKIEEEKAKED